MITSPFGWFAGPPLSIRGEPWRAPRSQPWKPDPGSNDAYRFTINAPQTVELASFAPTPSCDTAGAAAEMYADLTDPDGVLVATSLYALCQWPRTEVLTKLGQYQLRVYGSDEGAGGRRGQRSRRLAGALASGCDEYGGCHTLLDSAYRCEVTVEGLAIAGA